MNRTKLLQVYSVVTACLLFLAFGYAQAQDESMMDVNKTQHKPYTIDRGPVTLYGVTFSPYTEFFESSAYDGPRWDSLRYLVPELLPDAKEGQLNSSQFCDFIRTLSRNYAREEEVFVADIAYMLRPQFPDIEQEPDLIDEASLRLHSRDPAKLTELLEMLPDHENKVMKVKEWVMKTKTLVILHDAAMINLCPSYARSKRYELYSGSYYWEKTGKAFPDISGQ